jgi:hypothetical protein
MNRMVQPKMSTPRVLSAIINPNIACPMHYTFHLMERISVQGANLLLRIEFRCAPKQKVYSKSVRGSLSAVMHGDMKRIGHLTLRNDNRLNPLSRPGQLKRFLIVFQGKFMGNQLVDLNLAALKIIEGSRKAVDLGKRTLDR